MTTHTDHELRLLIIPPCRQGLLIINYYSPSYKIPMAYYSRFPHCSSGIANCLSLIASRIFGRPLLIANCSKNRKFDSCVASSKFSEAVSA
jgi:hypothetical protein